VTPTLTPAEVLDAAADYIRTHGWAQWQFKTCDGHVCALGAIYEVVGGYGDDRLAFDAAEDALIRTVGQTIGEWNDAPSRTADEVMDTLMEAAARLREAK
jgi:hypothetical protein